MTIRKHCLLGGNYTQGGCAGNLEAKRYTRNRKQEGTQKVWKAFRLEAAHMMKQEEKAQTGKG